MSIGHIEKDRQTFRKLVRGLVKKGLRKYMGQKELIGRKGDQIVSIPVPQIDIPNFRYETRGIGGTGRGEGDVGTPIAYEPGEGEPGQAGNLPGQHVLEVELTLEELAQMLGEELELPNIEPKGKKNIIEEVEEYTGISRTGPESLRHFKRTYKEALKRQIAAGEYDPTNPIVIPVQEDKRYRSWKYKPSPESNAIIFFMMDVSGSMADEQKEIVRLEAFWIDLWLRSQYKHVERCYIVHDAKAERVDEHTFYNTRESGGTLISSAYTLCDQIINKDYPAIDWNIYPFHFSDGDNWGDGDTQKCIDLLNDSLLPKSNLFCYGQVHSPYGSGRFKRDLDAQFDKEEKFVSNEIRDKEAIYDSIKAFLGKGK